QEVDRPQVAREDALGQPVPQQNDLFAAPPHPVVETLNGLDPDDLSPKRALELIYEWHRQR
uniref:hypothetical protein n=1 Tax=uncultured Cobetia sp. TaxID=410706 RepID=UPI0025964992